MSRQRLLALVAVVLAAGVFGRGSRAAGPAEGGHGGGAGHAGIAPRGDVGPHGGWCGGFRPGFRRFYGYPGWGVVGVGVGYGWGSGYPYYPYGFGCPIYYPIDGPPNGYPLVGPGPGVPGPAPPVRLTETDVLLSVRVPPDAVVQVNGAKTTQSGPRREFLSSGLSPGRTYTFTVSARWAGPNGEPVELERRLSVQGGERRAVDFLMPAPPQNDLPAGQAGAPLIR
jgi:uncharacterized protein (TIGR03000 family)